MPNMSMPVPMPGGDYQLPLQNGTWNMTGTGQFPMNVSLSNGIFSLVNGTVIVFSQRPAEIHLTVIYIPIKIENKQEYEFENG
jgi:hypothetical protein